MRAFRILEHCIKDAFKSVFRNFSLSLAAISCITITLVIVSFSIVLSRNVENFTNSIEEDLTIVTFISNDVENIDSIEEQINNINNIASITFDDKEKIKQDVMADSDVLASIMQEWTPEENPLKNTFLVKVDDVTKLNETATKIKSIEGVDTVQYGEGTVEQMVSAFNSIESASYVVVVALILVTVFLIINTIKLTIFSRKREISIMRLVGASNPAIKIPFIVEGIILGIIGSIIPIAIIVFGYPYLYEVTGGYIYTEIIELVPVSPFIYTTSLTVIVIGMVVGMIGSSSAVRRYLKV